MGNFESEIAGRVLLTSVAGLGGVAARFGDQRTSASNRQIPTTRRPEKARCHYLEGPLAQTSAEPAPPQECSGIWSHLKFEI
jgi:hypothetical protein